MTARQDSEKAKRKRDNKVYTELAGKNGVSNEDCEQIGRWKEGLLDDTSNKKWKSFVASVGYDVWIAAKNDPPGRPTNDGVAEFLQNWSDKKFNASKKNGMVQTKRFGLARATTLLHFISGGDFPIYDQFAGRGLRRLGGPAVPQPVTVRWYLAKFRPELIKLADRCGFSSLEDLRMLDKALWRYGKATVPISILKRQRTPSSNP